MSHQTLEYEELLRAAGHRITAQRLHILDAVCAGGGHTTLGEVYARVHQTDPALDRSTLYRTLKLFVKLGLVVSADIPDGDTYYEIAKPHRHHHLVCRQCGSELEIDDTLLNDVFDQLLLTYGFRVEADHLVLSGCCQHCRQQR